VVGQLVAHYCIIKVYGKYIYSFCNSNFAGDKGDKWLLTQISVPAASQTSDWNLLIQATAGDGVAGDIAIDGFKMTNGLCSGDQKTTGPGKNCSTINFFQLICINFTLRWLRPWRSR